MLLNFKIIFEIFFTFVRVKTNIRRVYIIMFFKNISSHLRLLSNFNIKKNSSSSQSFEKKKNSKTSKSSQNARAINSQNVVTSFLIFSFYTLLIVFQFLSSSKLIKTYVENWNDILFNVLKNFIFVNDFFIILKHDFKNENFVNFSRF